MNPLALLGVFMLGVAVGIGLLALFVVAHEGEEE
jgi:hypothetical protein